MPSPFPGVDPYIESQGYGPDFHGPFLTYLRDAINERLPDDYETRIDERFGLFETDARTRVIEPDLAVVRRPGPARAAVPAQAGSLLLEPQTLPIALTTVIEERHRWLEVRRLPDRSLVTVIELLSPTNKAGAGWNDYVDRRNDILVRDVHLVELDFLIAGRRVPLGGALPGGDFHTIVSRVELRPDCHVFSWTVRQPLPMLPIPLKAPDPDVHINLAAVYTTTYERGRYRRAVDYTAPIELPLSADQREWVETCNRDAPDA